jgi:hypothetical protein
MAVVVQPICKAVFQMGCIKLMLEARVATPSRIKVVRCRIHALVRPPPRNWHVTVTSSMDRPASE